MRKDRKPTACGHLVYSKGNISPVRGNVGLSWGFYFLFFSLVIHDIRMCFDILYILGV